MALGTCSAKLTTALYSSRVEPTRFSGFNQHSGRLGSAQGSAIETMIYIDHLSHSVRSQVVSLSMKCLGDAGAAP